MHYRTAEVKDIPTWQTGLEGWKTLSVLRVELSTDWVKVLVRELASD